MDDNNEQKVSALQQELQAVKAQAWDMQQQAGQQMEALKNGYQQLTGVLVEIGKLCGVEPTDKGLSLDAIMGKLKEALQVTA